MKFYPTVIYFICIKHYISTGRYYFKKVSGKLIEYGGYYFGVSYYPDEDVYKVTEISSGLIVGLSPDKIRFYSEESAIDSIDDSLIEVIKSRESDSISKLREQVKLHYDRFISC